MAWRVWLVGTGLMLGLAAVLFWPQSPPAVPQDIPLPDFDPPGFAHRAQPLRITFLGASLTRGDDWPEALAAALQPCLGQRPDITRIAKAGAHSGWGLAQVPQVVASNPDLVVIEFSVNDADLHDGLSRAQSVANHRQMIAQLQQALPQARILLMTMSPSYGLHGWIRPWLGSYYALYHPIAQQMGTGLADLYPRWLALPAGERKRLAPDGIHPEKGRAGRILTAAVPAIFAQSLCKGVLPT
jgi:acyl-CoA thioesterase-1